MSWPGDELVPDASMVFDTVRTVDAAPEEIWPWLVQLGKGRAGWYFPRRFENLLIPARRRATRTIEPQWQDLAVGDSVPDYGGRDETLEVARIDPPEALIYRSERGSAVFSWALLLKGAPERDRTQVHLRFRGKLASTGLKRRLIVGAGEFFDRSTGELMLRGLAERVAVASNSRADR